MLCFLFVPAFEYKIYCLMLYHLLKSTLHLKANACSIGTFIRFYMQSSLHSKANACNIGTFIRFYIQMRVQIKNKAFAYRFYRPFTQQCIIFEMPWLIQFSFHIQGFMYFPTSWNSRNEVVPCKGLKGAKFGYTKVLNLVTHIPYLR